MTKFSTRALGLAGVSVAAVVFGCPSAFAQTAESGGSQLEEVVVTAQRRDERLQDVPISVTALNAEALERQQVVDVIGLNKVTPGLLVKETFNPVEITVAIRGVTMLIPSINVDPPIGIYTDGIYAAVNAGSNAAMVDMERAEVLKGPQGTLFGRNTIGGAINITTAKPTNDFGGYLEGKVGNYGAWTATGVLNLPLAQDKLAARFVYQHTERDGYGTNVFTGSDIDTLDQDYFRGTVKANPNENWEFLLSAFYTQAHGSPRGTHLSYIDATSQLFPPPAPPLAVLYPALSGRPGDSLANYVGAPARFWDAIQDLDTHYSLKKYGLTGTITGELNDYVTLKSITGYNETDYFTSEDLDGTPYVVLHLPSFPIDYKQFSEELQVYGDAMDGRLSWIAGAYYFRGKGSQPSTSIALRAVGLSFGAPPTMNVQGPDPTVNTSVSAFAQVSYEIAPNLRLTGGVRRVRDERKPTWHDHVEVGVAPPGGTYLRCNMANVPGDPNPANCSFSDKAVFKYTPWTVGLDYKPTEDALIYAKVSKGFRSGAYGLGGPPATLPSATITPAQAAAANALSLATFAPVAPEKLVSYEAGAKLEFLDHRLRINAAAYWSSYDNIQVGVNLTAACPTCTPPNVLLNTGKAEIWGGELEVNALIGPLQLDGSLGYTHPKYVEGPNVGTPIVNVAKWNWSLSGSWPIEMDAGTLTLGATYSYRSKAYFFSITPGLSAAAAEALAQEGFGLLDARASFEFESVPVTVSVFGKNLANKEYIIGSSNLAPPLSYVVNWPGAPRTYGVSLRYDF